MSQHPELVVAHYNENLDWLEGREATVYKKGKDLPNIGREASTFAHHLLTKEPAEWTAFLQGNALDHCQDLFTVLDREQTDKVVPLHPFWECDPTGHPHHWECLDLDAAFRYILETECPMRYRFSPGAQYIVHRSCIPDRGMLERIVKMSHERRGPWELERLWWYIWTSRQSE